MVPVGSLARLSVSPVSPARALVVGENMQEHARTCGGVAQLGERLNGIQEVRGSIPLASMARPVVFEAVRGTNAVAKPVQGSEDCRDACRSL